MVYEWGQTAGYILAGYGASFIVLGAVFALRLRRLGKARQHLNRLEQREKTPTPVLKQGESL